MGMQRKTKPLCIIPARGNSKRLPRKNIRIFRGKPLIGYTIEVALESKIFDQVCVSSEDDEILEVAKQFGANFLHKRPEKLSADNAQVKEVCSYLLRDFKDSQKIQYDEFSVLLPCCPFRTEEDIVQSYEIFKKEKANFVLSVVPFSHPVQRAVWVPKKYIKPYFGIEYMKQTQSLDTCYRHDGSLITGKSSVFLRTNEFYGDKVVPYFIPPERSVDIDDILGLKWAEFLAEWQEASCKDKALLK